MEKSWWFRIVRRSRMADSTVKMGLDRREAQVYPARWIAESGFKPCSRSGRGYDPARDRRSPGAAAILAYRESHGPFQSPEEIMNVSGIKQAAYEKLKDQIVIR